MLSMLRQLHQVAVFGAPVAFGAAGGDAANRTGSLNSIGDVIAMKQTNV
jgi:hypothetical protein